MAYGFEEMIFGKETSRMLEILEESERYKALQADIMQRFVRDGIKDLNQQALDSQYDIARRQQAQGEEFEIDRDPYIIGEDLRGWSLYLQRNHNSHMEWPQLSLETAIINEQAKREVVEKTVTVAEVNRQSGVISPRSPFVMDHAELVIGVVKTLQELREGIAGVKGSALFPHLSGDLRGILVPFDLQKEFGTKRVL